VPSGGFHPIIGASQTYASVNYPQIEEYFSNSGYKACTRALAHPALPATCEILALLAPIMAALIPGLETAVRTAHNE
jgi:hypothetical protein